MRWEAWFLLAVLLLVVLMALSRVPTPLLFRAAPASPYAGIETEPRETSALYQVFMPALVPYHRLTSFVADTSGIKQIGCRWLTAWSERKNIPFFSSLVAGCY
jgi:hypothetical protein